MFQVAAAEVLLWMHGAYLVHYAMCERYGSGVKERLRRCRVRVDYSRINPILLEWIHNFETSSILALSWPAATISAVFSFAVLCCIFAKFETQMASRRVSDLLISSLCLAPRRVAGPVQLHAWLVPSRRTPFLAHLISASLCVCGWTIAAATLAFLARDLGHLYQRNDGTNENDDDRDSYVGYAATYPVNLPTSLFFTQFANEEEAGEKQEAL